MGMWGSWGVPVNIMIDTTLTPAAVARFYDRLGARHDMGAMFERRAKQRGIYLLDVQPGDAVFNAGAGVGKDNVALLKAAGPTGRVVAADLSAVMLHLGRRAASRADYCQANVKTLPFADNLFDRILATYLIDLLPAATISATLAEFHRVLRPGGRLALVSLTEGVNAASRAVVGAWKAAFAIYPLACGGCRPVQLVPWVEVAGLDLIRHETVVQLGVPSEVVLAERPASATTA